MQTASLTTLIIVGIGLALMYRFLFKPKKGEAIRDERPTTLTLRGEFVPVVMGRRRVAPVFAWAGGRKTITEKVKVGGKGFGGGSTIETDVFYEQGWHILTIGPVHAIEQIYVQGAEILDAPIYAYEFPSGSQIDVEGQGSFRIYWGEDTQPFESLLDAAMGIASRWHPLCYIMWDRKRLSTNPTWQNIEYRLVQRPIGIDLPTAASWLDDGTSEGVNPAYAIYRLLTGPYPYGIGFPEEWVNLDDLDDLGTLATTEHLPANILIQGGDDLVKILGELMQNVGFILPECDGVISFYEIRELGTDPPDLDNDLMLPPVEEIEQFHQELRHDNIVYMYDDENHQFKPMPIPVDDDSFEDQRNRRRTRKLRVSSFTHRAVVSTIADRRQLEDLVPPMRLKINGQRGLRKIRPGQPLDLSGVGTIRVMAYKFGWKNPVVELDLMRDFYSAESTGYVDPEVPVDPNVVLADDLRWRTVELPYWASPDKTRVITLRVRAHQEIIGANQHTSLDDTTFNYVTQQRYSAVGGTLATSWRPDDRLRCITDGPVITIDNNGDVSDNLDLTGNDPEWQGGRLMMIINDELFFIRKLEQITGQTYQAKEVIRARMDTIAEEHDSGDEVFVFDSELMIPFRWRFWPVVGTVYFKNQPFDFSDVIPIGDLTSKSLALLGKTQRGLPVDNFRVGPFSDYGTGDDIVFTWTYRVKNEGDKLGTTAGEPMDTGIAAPSQPTRDGHFIIRIFDGVTLKNTITISDDTGTVTYGNSEMQADFGGEPASFTAQILNKMGGYEGQINTITITKR